MLLIFAIVFALSRSVHPFKCTKISKMDRQPLLKKSITESFTIETGDIYSVYNAAYMMAIERLNSAPGQAVFTSPVFNMVYVRELTRLKANYCGDRNLHQILIAKCANTGDVVGYLDIDQRDIFSTRFPTPYISDIVVNRNWRNQGIATKLLEASYQLCVQWGSSHVHLWVERDNIDAIKLYSKHAFKPIKAESGPIDDVSSIRTITTGTNEYNFKHYDCPVLINYERLLLRKEL